MRLTVAAMACLLVVLPAMVSAQQSTPSSASDVDLRTQMDSVVQLLQQTRQELQASRDEVKALRAEMNELKSSLAPKAASQNVEQQVDQLSEAQAVTDSRVEQIYQSKVESGSKYRVKLSGLILFNAGMNRGAVDNSDVPMLALRKQPGQPGGDVHATMRQTFFTVAVNGPDFLGAKTSGDVQFDFFGGFPSTIDGAALGLLRLRTGHAQLEWKNGSIVVGQDQPFISPLSPTSLATVGTPAFGYSGNLWTWTPQVVASRKFAWSDSAKSTVQIGALDPFSGEVPSDPFDRTPEPGEASRMPALAVRHALGFTVAGREFTIGTSGLYNRHDFGFGRTVDGFAATVDWMLPIAKQFEVSGEFFRGRAIGGLWGAIGTSVVMDGPETLPTTRIAPVNAIGGWTQLKYKPATRWEINSAFGIDNPYTADIRRFSASSSTYRPTLRNSSEMFNIIHRPRSNLVLSLEYRHLNTINYTIHRYSAENVSLGIGVYF